MGRSILVEDSNQDYVERLLKNGQWSLGLIIGQLTNQRDYGVQLIRTPEPVEDEVSEEEGEEILTNRKRKRRKSSHKPDSLEKIDEQWVATHARQVTRMLPGGLDVIGIFAMAKPAVMEKSQSKLRQILFTIQKSHDKNQMVHEEDGITDKYLLQICSQTRKLTCRTIDTADPKSAFRPGDWKFHSSREQWIELKCPVSADMKMVVPLGAQNHSLLKQILTGIKPYCQSIWNALATVNGEMRDQLEPLDQSVSNKKGRGREKGATEQQCYNISVFSQLISSSQTPRITENSSMIVLRGHIHSRAYVPCRGTVGDAIKAVKTDIMRSLVSRCELLCEDIEVVEEVKGKELYDTPVRVFGPLPGTTVNFCDYIFQDEKTQEVIERIQELLDVTVSEEKLQLDCERVATEDDWPRSQPVEGEVNPIKSMAQVRIYLGALLGGAAAVLAGMSYLYMADS